jgi:hypothetical protein
MAAGDESWMDGSERVGGITCSMLSTTVRCNTLLVELESTTNVFSHRLLPDRHWGRQAVHQVISSWYSTPV